MHRPCPVQALQAQRAARGAGAPAVSNTTSRPLSADTSSMRPQGEAARCAALKLTWSSPRAFMLMRRASRTALPPLPSALMLSWRR